MFESNQLEVLNYQLHGFADTSKRAHCAIVFLACKTVSGSYTRLLCSKLRFAPLKELAIPHLELMTARMFATLAIRSEN